MHLPLALLLFAYKCISGLSRFFALFFLLFRSALSLSLSVAVSFSFLVTLQRTLSSPLALLHCSFSMYISIHAVAFFHY